MARNWEDVRREAAEAGFIDEQRVENAKRELMTNATRAATLTEFLLARIADDEAAVMKALDWPTNASSDHWPRAAYEAAPDYPDSSRTNYHLSAAPPRILAEFEAKRRIMGEHGSEDWCQSCYDIKPMDAPCPTLRHLAAVYSDHEDYCEEWS